MSVIQHIVEEESAEDFLMKSALTPVGELEALGFTRSTQRDGLPKWSKSVVVNEAERWQIDVLQEDVDDAEPLATIYLYGTNEPRGEVGRMATLQKTVSLKDVDYNIRPVLEVLSRATWQEALRQLYRHHFSDLEDTD